MLGERAARICQKSLNKEREVDEQNGKECDDLVDDDDCCCCCCSLRQSKKEGHLDKSI